MLCDAVMVTAVVVVKCRYYDLFFAFSIFGVSRILVLRAHSFVFLLLVFAVVVAFPHTFPSPSPSPLSPPPSSIFESRVHLLSVRPLNLEHSVSVLSSRCEVRGYVCKAQYVFLSFNAIGDLEFRLVCSFREMSSSVVLLTRRLLGVIAFKLVHGVLCLNWFSTVCSADLIISRSPSMNFEITSCRWKPFGGVANLNTLWRVLLVLFWAM